MDWLNQKTEYSKGDSAEFAFCPGEEFNVTTVTLTAQNDDIDAQIIEHKSEPAFQKWLDNFSPIHDQPTFSLIIHERCRDQANSLPYSEETFNTASEKLYQHRSLTWSMQRTSTSIFSSTRTNWTVNKSKEQVIVYNCRSDTDTLKFNEDILLSTTYFADRPWVFSAIYGYPEGEAEFLATRLETFKEPTFHPLMMPMAFIEHERSRFMEDVELKGPKLRQRIMNLENRLQVDEKQKKQTREQIKKENQEMTQKDCESAKLWDEVSRLRNGMASFQKVLASMEQQFESFKDLKLVPHLPDTDEMVYNSISSEHIKCRLRELDAEVDGNIRKCEGLLAGMALAIQVEWNYHTRRDAKANIFIARASHQDSTQMKMISWIGMIFLPGTFLATFFSMSFFQWIPDDSSQVISPWVCVYVGLTAIITGVIAFIWWRRTKDQPDLGEFLEYIGVDDLEKGVKEPKVQSHRKRSHESSVSGGTEACLEDDFGNTLSKNLANSFFPDYQETTFKESLRTTPLNRAICLRNFEAAKILIDYGADTSASHYQNPPALHPAAENGSFEILEYILRTYDACSEYTWTISEVLAHVLSYKLERSAARQSQIIAANHSFLMKIPCSLLFSIIRSAACGRGAGFSDEVIDAELGSPLMAALRSGQKEVVKFLVRRGCLLTGIGDIVMEVATHFPDILHWLFVQRFIRQGKLTAIGEDKGPQEWGETEFEYTTYLHRLRQEITDAYGIHSTAALANQPRRTGFMTGYDPLYETDNASEDNSGRNSKDGTAQGSSVFL
ncbi:hypothetical protein G7054_g5880 [Neopestalotiopsis clavispora]|nr:hypothetical protein G7054_g5880 [Neopestalotiopsis clavispora]